MAGLHSAWRFGFRLDAERGTACAGLLLSMQTSSPVPGPQEFANFAHVPLALPPITVPL